MVNSPVLTSEKVAFSVYTYLPPKKNIWLPGKYQDWNQFGTEIWETEAGTSTYKILVDVSNDAETPYYFKIVDENQSWVGMNEGYTPEGWEVADPSNSDGNFSVSADEPIMWLTISTKTKTVAREVVSKVAMIGDFNGWNESEEKELTYNAAKNVWESPVISFTEGQGWLLRLNKNWDHKYGSAVATNDIAGGYEITKGGENIPTPGTGDYIVRLYANRTPIVVTYENSKQVRLMKWIRNIFAVSAAAFAAVACTIESEDTFSKSPVAPVLEAHSDILITEGTKAESVTFTWTAARQIDAEAYLIT